MIGARVPQCLSRFHKLDTAGRGLQGEQRGDGAGLEKQPVWSDKKRADQGADRERERERKTERDGDRDRRRDLEVWGMGDGMCSKRRRKNDWQSHATTNRTNRTE